MSYSSAPFSIDQIGFIQTVTSDVLAAAAQGKLDLNRLAAEELASRGMDHEGKWIGFQQAKALLDARDVPALRPDHPEQSGNDYIFNDSVHRGFWVSIGDISVHVFKPIENDRVQVDLVAKGREDDHPADSATMFLEDAAPVDAAPVASGIPQTWKAWELYDMEGVEAVGKELTGRLTALLEQGADDDTVHVQMGELMMRHRRFGAADTVVRELLARVIENPIGRSLVTPSQRHQRPRG